MTKVLCIKDTIGFTKGEVYEAVCDDKCLYWYKDNYINWTENLDYFQEVKEEEKALPRWKVGDYFVIKWDVARQFQKVNELYCSLSGSYYYNWFLEESLRNPTPEELKIFFI